MWVRAFEKPAAREDRTGLVKKQVTDKTGKRTTVYVSPDQTPPGGTDGDPSTPDHDPKTAAHAADQLADHLPDEVKSNPGVMAQVFAAVNEALGTEGAPDAAAIEAKLREVFG